MCIYTCIHLCTSYYTHNILRRTNASLIPQGLLTHNRTRSSNQRCLRVYKLNNSTCRLLFSIIIYIIDDGISHLKLKAFFIFIVFLWSISNICLRNIEIDYLFLFSVSWYLPARSLLLLVTFYCLESDWWLHFSAVGTTELYCVSPDPCLGYGCEANAFT